MKSSKTICRRQKIERFYAGLAHEIAGPFGSGKSRLCHDELVSYLHGSPGQAVIIDTNGSFSPRDMAELIKSRDGDAHMLDRIQITRCLDIYGIVEAIQEVQASFVVGQRPEEKIGFILIDNMTNPMSLMMQKGQTPGHDLMVCVARELTLLSRLQQVCILVINSTVRAETRMLDNAARGDQDKKTLVTQNRDAAFADVKVKPALGNTWSHLLDYCLLLYPVPEGTPRVPGKRGFVQEVIRSRIGGVGEWEMV